MPLRIVEDPLDPVQRVRSAHVVIPPDWWQHLPLPIVFGFHGGDTSRPTAFADTTRLHELASPVEDVNGIPRFITVYPEALAPKARDGDGNAWVNGWNAPAADLWSPDDVGFVARLIQVLETKLDAAATRAGLATPAVSREQVYAFGFSSGASFTYHLAVRLPRVSPYVLTGFCVYSGTIGAAARPNFVNDPNVAVGPNPVPPATMIAFHGTLDMDMPFSGGIAGPPRDGLISERDVDPATADLLMPEQLPGSDGPNLWAARNGVPPLVEVPPGGVNDPWGPFRNGTPGGARVFAGRVGGIAAAFAEADYFHEVAGQSMGAGKGICRMALRYLLNPMQFV